LPEVAVSKSLSSVLLIEDNPGDARLVREHLSDRFGDSCRLHEASSLDGGLRWLDTHRPDLILLDLSLPDSQGLDTFLSVHAHAPDTPVVIFSGRDDDELALDAVRAGAEDFLTKQHAHAGALVRSMRHAVERRKVEGALRERAGRYRIAGDTAEAGVLQLDAQGSVQFVNGRAAALLALPASELLGRRLADLAGAEDADAVAAFLAGATEGRQCSLPARFPLPDGGEVWALLSAQPEDDGAGLAVTLSDITGRVLAERELAQLAGELEDRVAQRTAQLEAANAELALFNRSIAHDLRTPLNAIVGFATMLELQPGFAPTDKARHHLEMVQKSALGMGDLVNAMLALSQVERSQFRRQRLDLSAMAEDVLAQLQAAGPDRAVQIDIQPGVDAIGDPALVRDVLVNLLSNAWKYTRQTARPWIRFSVERRAGGEPVYGVEDNGVGFDVKDGGLLFQPFQRLPSSEGFEGTGVGLATVQRIVQRHDGRIWAQSRPGERTGFFFTLGKAGPETGPRPAADS
jgi:PAS domain S-box-containing protein